MVKRVKPKMPEIELEAEQVNEREFIDISTTPIIAVILTQIFRVVISFFTMELLRSWWKKDKDKEKNVSAE